MAKSHVVQYFLEVEHQYLEMLDNVKDFKELAKSFEEIIQKETGIVLKISKSIHIFEIESFIYYTNIILTLIFFLQ